MAQKIDPYDMQMRALTQLANSQSNADDRRADTNTQAQMLRHLGGFQDIASNPVATQSEIMAKQTPVPPPGFGQTFDTAAKGMEAQGEDQYRSLLDRHKMQNQMAMTLARMKEIEDDKKDKDLKRRLMEAQIEDIQTKTGKEKGAPPPLTKGQERGDIQFAVEWSKFKNLGGSSTIEKNLSQLQKVRNALNDVVQQKKGAPGVSGPIMGKMPEWSQAIFTPTALDMQEAVSEVAQSNLRSVLGGQFAEKEGEQLIKRAFNPQLDEKTNLERVDRLINQIKESAKAKIDAGKWFDQYGTLSNYKGSLGEGSQSDTQTPGLSIKSNKSGSLMDSIIPSANASEKSFSVLGADQKSKMTIDQLMEYDKQLSEMLGE